MKVQLESKERLKTCTKCKTKKPTTEFHKKTSAKSGLCSHCKSCVKKYNAEHKTEIAERGRKYRVKHKVEICKRKQKYHAEHKTEIDKKNKTYYINHKVEIAERKRKYRIKHAVEIIENRRKYCIKHSDKIIEQTRKWRKNNRDKHAAIQAKRRANKIAQTPVNADMKKIGEFYTEARRLTEEIGIPHEVDHIIPISKGGLHHEDNLQILTKSENCRKSDKLPEELEK